MENDHEKGISSSISIRDFIFEYASNSDLRDYLASGDFIFVDGQLLVNDRKNFVVDPDGNRRLTDYANSHKADCCLFFEQDTNIKALAKVLFYKRINRKPKVKEPRFISVIKIIIGLILLFIVNAVSVTVIMILKIVTFPIRKKAEKFIERLIFIYTISEYISEKTGLNSWLNNDENEYAWERLITYTEENKSSSKLELPFWAHLSEEEQEPAENRINTVFSAANQSVEVFERSLEHQKLRDELLDIASIHKENPMSFSKLAWAHIERCHCTGKESFRERTLLSDRTFDRIKAGKLINPDLETVMALCIGLNLGSLHSEPLLRSAGFDFTNSSIPLYMVYRVLLSTFKDHSIFECNEVLEALRLPPIRAKAYKEMQK